MQPTYTNGHGHHAEGPTTTTSQRLDPRVERIVEQLPIDKHDVVRWQEQASDLDRKARGFIRDNPTAAVAGAVALGFLIGRLVTR
jgi:ElaB/YqjD/DUF883 family membrane-anchored ribosome-binding protein